jgi:hypothetical protein
MTVYSQWKTNAQSEKRIEHSEWRIAYKLITVLLVSWSYSFNWLKQIKPIQPIKPINVPVFNALLYALCSMRRSMLFSKLSLLEI